MIRCLWGVWIWTYKEIDKPIIDDPDERTLVTAIKAISASGYVIPPFVIVPRVNLPSKFFYNNLDTDAMLKTSLNGYIDDQIALEWLEHFNIHTTPSDENQKRLLLLNGHDSHTTLKFWQKCQEFGVIPFRLPPHLTHFLQPLDIGVFQVYKH